MRTRIALVAIIPIACITVTLLGLAATAQPARATVRVPQASSTHRADRLLSVVTTPRTGAARSRATTTAPDLRIATALLTGHAAGQKESTPVVPPVAAMIDTVTPYERAAWSRVAMCEEGGNWQADGSRFSGGLGITRANWSIFGGQQYASEAALATPDQQIMVAERIQSYPPDQHGCSSW